VAGIMDAQRDQQAPVFKGEVQAQITLRRVAATLSRADLERLAQYGIDEDGEPVGPAFASPYAEVPAEPSWETTDATYHPPLSRRPDLERKSSQQKLMDYYNRLRKAGLVETTDDKDLFWTVMASIDEPGKGHAVKLTPLGRYYWELSSRQQIGRSGD
jgi:hypothetical protein